MNNPPQRGGSVNRELMAILRRNRPCARPVWPALSRIREEHVIWNSAERCWDEALEGETNGAFDAGGDFLGRRVGMGRLRRNRADARRIPPLGPLQTGFRRV